MLKIFFFLKSLIFHLIYNNDLTSLKNLEIHKRNLNYLKEYNEINLDTKIHPLLCACYLGRSEIVKYILQNPSIDIDLGSFEAGHTPLTIACLTANYEILQMLIEGDAEVNKPNAFNQTPLIASFARLEEENNVYENKKLCFKMAELLLQNGADINWIVDKKKGFSLLLQLCAVKLVLNEKEKEINFQTIKFLLENGANKFLQSNKGKNAFDLAKKHCNKDKILDLLSSVDQIYFYNGTMKMPRNPIPIPSPGLNEEDKKKKKSNWISYMSVCKK